MEDNMKLKRGFEESLTVYDTAKAYEGYTLFAPHYTKEVWLIDMMGRPVERWDMDTHLGGTVRLLPTGNQLRLNKSYREPTGSLGTVGEFLYEADWSGKTVWNYQNKYMHHDCRRLPNGNTLALAHLQLPREIAADIKGGIPGTEGLSGARSDVMWGDSVLEISPEGEIVWEWIGYEHMDLGIDILCPLCPRTAWPYLNGIDVFPNGDIVVSPRLLNCLFVIDKKSKAIKKRLARHALGHQHNPTVLENGNVLVIDNGFHRLPPKGAAFSAEAYSRVLEIDPERDEVVWEYKPEAPFDFFAAVGSGAGRLPNGNTLICDMPGGRIFEVTPESELVWEFINPVYTQHEMYGSTNAVFQAHRYGRNFPGFEGKQLDPDRFALILVDGEQPHE